MSTARRISVGITFSHYDWPDEPDNRWRIDQYLGAIDDAGGCAEPLWIPRREEQVRAPSAHDYSASMNANASAIAERLDGLVLSGGADLPPRMYGEPVLADIPIDLINPARTDWELGLLSEFVSRRKPVLGICYGCQLLNVWRGGTLIQDIPSQFASAIEHGSGRHNVTLHENSRLCSLIGEHEFEVVTSHHQAISRLAVGASTAAFAPDRLNESIEFEDASFLLGVQWHPERDRSSNATKRLFSGFLEACAGGTVTEPPPTL